MTFHTLARIVTLTGARSKVLLPSPSGNITQCSLFSPSCHRLRLLGKSEISAPSIPVTAVNSAEKTLLQSIYKGVKKVIIPSQHGRVWMRSALFCSVFLTPTMMSLDSKETPVLFVKSGVRKKRGMWIRLLLSIYEFFRMCLRVVQLFVTFTPILILYPITYFGKTPTDAWWHLMLKGIELSGPILMKLGQWVSTRRDLFPDSCCSQFSRLQRRIKPHSWRFTVYQMRKAFGPKWREIFVKFDNDDHPIGSGCVAQVYKVWMNTETIPDEDLVEEILSEMDEDSSDIYEGLEVMGFGYLLGDEGHPDNLTEWKQLRNERRSQEQHTQDSYVLSTAQEGALSDDQNLKSNLPSEEPQDSVNSLKTEETLEKEAEDLVHQLVEEWQEGEMDKSLPLREMAPDDLEGLIPVAVKVLHPGVSSTFRRDLKILRMSAQILTAVVPSLKWLSLPQCVDEFAQVMEAQINLRSEARNLEIFSSNFSDVPSVKFPRPLRPYVTSQVLVETYEEGDAMLDVLRASEELKKHLAQIGVDALLKMIFVDNLVHGDLHPGNLLVQNITKGTTSGDQTRIMMVDIGCDTFVMDVQPDPSPLRICFLDCGIASKLCQKNLDNIRAVFKQIILGDGESVAELFLKNSEHQCTDLQAFRTEVDMLVQAARESTVSLSQVDVGVLLQQMLGLLLKHQVRLESAFSAVVLAVFVLEGLGRSLDPDMNILERARPILVTNNLP